MGFHMVYISGTLKAYVEVMALKWDKIKLSS